MTVSSISTNPEDLSNNKLQPGDRAFHDWYRFVLSYPPHLVRHYFNQFGLTETATVLDPFCGTGQKPLPCSTPFAAPARPS